MCRAPRPNITASDGSGRMRELRQACQAIENAWLDASPWCGSLAIAERHAARRRRSVVLCYHGVVPPRSGGFQPHEGMNVTPEQFEAHLAHLSQHFDVLSLDALVARWLDGAARPRPAVAITFDDAYRNNLEFAVPLLERYGCPATIFVAVGYIDTGRPFWWESIEHWVRDCDRRVELDGEPFDLHALDGKHRLFEALRLRLTAAGPTARDALLARARELLTPVGDVPTTTMSWREIEALAERGGVRFGPHTVSHAAVSRLTDAELVQELAGSQQQLARHVRAPSAIFAYPYGRYGDIDARSGAVLQRLGAAGAVTLVAGALEDSPGRYALRRVYVSRDDGVRRLRAKLAGVDAPFWRARRLLGRGERMLPAEGR
jgi:peptidoglycan/xylan/chitin deacetylase (PgdA/CDA1 family)